MRSALITAALVLATSGADLRSQDCVAEAGGECRDGRALRVPQDVAISSDGNSVYVLGGDPSGSDADLGELAVFDRDAATGALAQKPGAAGCLTTTGSDGCRAAPLRYPQSVVVSPDGRHVYMTINRFAGSGGVAVLQRAPSGEVTWAGCITDDGAGACADGRALDEATGLALSPDGRTLYVAASGANAVAVLSRNPGTGALTPAGCVGAAAGCAPGPALDGVARVAVSPDGRHVYASSPSTSTVAVLSREPGGGLSQAGCIAERGDGTCRSGRALANAGKLEVSADGRNVFVVSMSPTTALAVLARDPVTGSLTHSGCATLTGRDTAGANDACTVAPGLQLATDVTSDARHIYVSSSSSTPGASAVLAFERETLSPAGCVGETTVGGACRDGRGLDGAFAITLSPDQRHAYVAAVRADALAILGRGDAAPGEHDGPSEEPTTDDGDDEPVEPSPPGGGSRPRDTTAPRITRVARSSAHLRVTLSEPAALRLVLSRALPGRRDGGRCVAPTRRNRVRCTRFVRVATLDLGNARQAGTTTVRLPRRALAAGRYRATLFAIDAARNRSRGRTLRIEAP